MLNKVPQAHACLLLAWGVVRAGAAWGGDALRSLYMVQSLALGRGALSALVLMAVGESTSVLQNGWYIARAMRARSQVRLTSCLA